uniref:NTR domain-containing protein n=1 Tax=Meloidogyne incognita TaxID=6306 RepID=A0A914NAF8_MELIC
MKIIIFYLILSILIVKCINIESSNCPCNPSTVENKYCYSNWVAHVQILNRSNSRYKVKIIKMYKGVQGKAELISPPQSSCGVFLENGKEYLISASYGWNLNSKILSECRINLKWNQVSKKVKEKLNNGEINKYCLLH